jgi:hypothetical protein
MHWCRAGVPRSSAARERVGAACSTRRRGTMKKKTKRRCEEVDDDNDDDGEDERQMSMRRPTAVMIGSPPRRAPMPLVDSATTDGGWGRPRSRALGSDVNVPSAPDRGAQTTSGVDGHYVAARRKPPACERRTRLVHARHPSTPRRHVRARDGVADASPRAAADVPFERRRRVHPL